MSGEGPPPEAVVWHDAECGAYSADLALWRELADAAGGRVLEVGAGTGRVALALARHGHEVTALDAEPVLLEELARRARGLPVETVVADARSFETPGRFALVLVPMQTLQVLGGPEGRAAFLGAARAHMRPGALLAAAIAGPLPPIEPEHRAHVPPDVAQHGGWAYFSQPTRVREDDGGGTVIERVRTAVSPGGERTQTRDEVRLDPLDAATAAAEARVLGYEPLEPREIAPTHEHVGSTVVRLRRRQTGAGARRSASRRAEAALAPLAGGELGHLDGIGGGERDHQQLRDAIAGRDLEGGGAGVEQEHAHLAAVAGVDQPGRVDQGDPVPGGETGAREHEGRVALGDLDGDAGPHRRPPAGGDRLGLGRVEVQPRVAGVSAGGKRRLLAEPPDRKADGHPGPGAGHARTAKRS